MKIVGIISSPNYNGNTAVLVKEALLGAAERGAEVDEIFLPFHQLNFCKGCFSCLSEGRCLIPDDLEYLRKKLYYCDGIIIGSPAYGLEPNALMKNFLDRIGLLSVYSSALGDKYVVGIATARAIGARRVAGKLTGITGGFFQNGYVSGVLGVTLGWERVEKYPKHLMKARRLGGLIAEDIKRHRKYPMQRLLKKAIGLLLRKAIKENIIQHSEDQMRAVYRILCERGLVTP